MRAVRPEVTSRLVDKCERTPAGSPGYAPVLPVDVFPRCAHTSDARGRRSKLNSRAGTGLMCLSSTPVPPTAAKIGGLTIFDFVAGDISRLRRDVKGVARTAR